MANKALLLQLFVVVFLPAGALALNDNGNLEARTYPFSSSAVLQRNDSFYFCEEAKKNNEFLRYFEAADQRHTIASIYLFLNETGKAGFLFLDTADALSHIPAEALSAMTDFGGAEEAAAEALAAFLKAGYGNDADKIVTAAGYDPGALRARYFTAPPQLTAAQLLEPFEADDPICHVDYNPLSPLFLFKDAGLASVPGYGDFIQASKALDEDRYEDAAAGFMIAARNFDNVTVKPEPDLPGLVAASYACAFHATKKVTDKRQGLADLCSQLMVEPRWPVRTRIKAAIERLTETGKSLYEACLGFEDIPATPVLNNGYATPRIPVQFENPFLDQKLNPYDKSTTDDLWNSVWNFLKEGHYLSAASIFQAFAFMQSKTQTFGRLMPIFDYPTYGVVEMHPMYIDINDLFSAGNRLSRYIKKVDPLRIWATNATVAFSAAKGVAFAAEQMTSVPNIRTNNYPRNMDAYCAHGGALFYDLNSRYFGPFRDQKQVGTDIEFMSQSPFLPILYEDSPHLRLAHQTGLTNTSKTNAFATGISEFRRGKYQESSKAFLGAIIETTTDCMSTSCEDAYWIRRLHAYWNLVSAIRIRGYDICYDCPTPCTLAINLRKDFRTQRRDSFLEELSGTFCLE